MLKRNEGYVAIKQEYMATRQDIGPKKDPVSITSDASHKHQNFCSKSKIIVDTDVEDDQKGSIVPSKRKVSEVQVETASKSGTVPAAIDDCVESTHAEVVVTSPAPSKASEKDKGNQKKATLKNRHQNSHPEKEDRMCSFIIRGEDCPYKGSCQYNHDIFGFLSKKEPDLADRCHVFDTFGYCPNGIACRFGKSHLDPETGANVRRGVEQGGVVEREPINALSKEVQLLLRKKKYLAHIKERQKEKKAAESAAVARVGSAQDDAEKNRVNASGCEATETIKGVANQDSSVPNTAASKDESCTDTLHRPPKTAEPAGSSKILSGSPVPYSYATGSWDDRRGGRVKLVDFSNKVYVAPLTTVGNLPFRRVMKDFGADITCGEMAMAYNIIGGQASEWALLRRHESEDIYGVQLAGNNPDLMGNVCKILENETRTDFVDLNCGCPIDVVCNRGAGSSLMNKPSKLCGIMDTMMRNLPSRCVTVKIRTGWDEKDPTTHKLVPQLQKTANGRLGALMIHGRSRLQRYHRLADWKYVLRAAQAQDPTLPRFPVIGNGDILSWDDWRAHQELLEDNMHRRVHLGESGVAGGSGSWGGAGGEFVRAAENSPSAAELSASTSSADFTVGGAACAADALQVGSDGDAELRGLCSCAMLARGALIKPWLPSEIKQQRTIDISASERLDMLKSFCNYGLEHWGSDQQGVNNTRRFLLEWLSFLHRYVPAGLVEAGYPQRMNQRPGLYFGRSDLETLLASPNSDDWVKISELLLGPVGKAGYSFAPKHKSNSYAPEHSSSTSTSASRGGGDNDRNEDSAASGVGAGKGETGATDWG